MPECAVVAKPHRQGLTQRLTSTSVVLESGDALPVVASALTRLGVHSGLGAEVSWRGRRARHRRHRQPAEGAHQYPKSWRSLPALIRAASASCAAFSCAPPLAASVRRRATS